MSRSRFIPRQQMAADDDDDWDTDADFVNKDKMETVKSDGTMAHVTQSMATASIAAQSVKSRQVAADRERGVDSLNVNKHQMRTQEMDRERGRVAQFEHRQAEATKRVERAQQAAAARRKRVEQDREDQIKAREDSRMRAQEERDRDIEERRRHAQEEGKRDELAKVEREQAFFAQQDQRLRNFEDEQRQREDVHKRGQEQREREIKAADDRRISDMERRNASIDDIVRQRETDQRNEEQRIKQAENDFYARQAEREKQFDAEQQSRENRMSQQPASGTGDGADVGGKAKFFVQASQHQEEAPRVQPTGKKWTPPPAAAQPEEAYQEAGYQDEPQEQYQESYQEPAYQEQAYEEQPQAAYEEQPQAAYEEQPQAAYEEQPQAYEEPAADQYAEQPYEEQPQEATYEEPATDGTGGESQQQCQALYDYEAAEEGDLPFSAGDLINLTDTSDPSGWWMGELNGVYGQFPSNFVEMV